MRARFLVPFPIEDHLTKIIETCRPLLAELRAPTEAFCDSVLAVHATTSLPYQLAHSKAGALHFQRIHIAERIRKLPVSDEDYAVPEVDRDLKALEIAREKYHSFQHSDDGLNALVADLSNTLLEGIEEPSTAKAADELLYQAVVGLWSALEVLVRDGLIVVTNHYPQVAVQLLNNPQSKKYFEFPTLSIEKLSSSQFNLSSCMGDLIFGTRDFSDVRTIKAAFSSISNDATLIDVLNDPDLWQLNQCRHVIVHRRGVVDAKYKASTKCQSALGERIPITPQDVEKFFRVTIQSAAAIIKGMAAAVAMENTSCGVA